MIITSGVPLLSAKMYAPFNVPLADAYFSLSIVGTFGIRDFGESAPVSDLFPEFGFTVDNVVEEALKVIERDKNRDK